MKPASEKGRYVSYAPFCWLAARQVAHLMMPPVVWRALAVSQYSEESMDLVKCRGAALSLFLVVLPYRAAAEDGVGSRPVAEILGKPVRLQDLDAGTGPDGAKTSAAGDRDARQRQRGERLRTLVWQAVLEDYAQQRKIAPTAAEIDSHVAHLREFQKQDRLRREQQRAELITELTHRV